MDDHRYFRIRFNTIRPEKVTTFPIFIRVDHQMILYLREGSQISDVKIESLDQKDNGNSYFIMEQDRNKYRQ